MEKSKSTIPEVKDHPLREEITKRGLRLWQLRMLIDDSACEATLSRALRGVIPMPPHLEERIAGALGRLEGGAV